MPTTEKAARERPIVMNGAMVRAILEGRKTQTRRVVKPQPPAGYEPHIAPDFAEGKFRNGYALWQPECPHGKPGDRLWVRETWRLDFDSGSGSLGADGRYRRDAIYRVVFKAGGDDTPIEWEGFDDDADPYIEALGRDDSWRPSVHMPRWASRLTLRIAGVRVERVQDISEADAIAEGIDSARLGNVGWLGTDAPREAGYSYIPAFRELWGSINAGRGHSWASNPWVWALTFERVD